MKTTQHVLVWLSLVRVSGFHGLAYLHRACVQNRIATKYVIGGRFTFSKAAVDTAVVAGIEVAAGTAVVAGIEVAVDTEVAAGTVAALGTAVGTAVGWQPSCYCCCYYRYCW